MKCKLGDIAEVTMGQSPKSEFYNADGNGTPFLQGNRTFGSKYPTFDTFTTFVTKPGKAGDVIMSVRAPVGDVNITPVDICLGRGVCSLRMKNGNQEFLYYMMRHYAQALRNCESGTVFGSVNKNDVNGLDVEVPSEKTQRKIAAILSALDDKIELNRRINAKLEEQLEAVYKAWFQEFTQVKATRMIETQYGAIPTGWHWEALGSLCESVSKTHKFDKQELVFLNTGDIENGQFLHSNYTPVEGMPGQAKKTMKRGDVLYSEIRPINRHFAYVNFQADDYVVSTKLMVVRAKSIDSRRLYHFLTREKTLAELQMQAESRSGTFPQIRFDNVGKLPILIADDKTEKQFIDLLHISYAQIERNNLENEKLAAMRDALTPRLMSGEIDVANVAL